MVTTDVPVSKLRLWDKNPRQITDQDFEKLKSSLEKNPEFVFKRPLLVNLVDGKHIVYAGNMRLRAVKALGWKTVPCIIEENIPEDRMNEEAIKDNVEYGTWDMDLLASNFGEEFLRDIDVPFREFGLEEIENPEEDARKEAIEDHIPEVRSEVFVRKGDIFQLGRHRLMCGDSTSQKDVAMLMDGKKANMVFTDPPYNVNYKGSGENTSEGIMNDHMDSDLFDTFLDDIFARYQESIEEKSGVYVFHSTSTQTAFQNAMERNKFHIKNQLIWNKPMASLGWGDYRWKHEPFYYASSSEGSANFYGDRTHATVIDSFDGKTDQDILTMIKNAREAEKSGKATIWTMSRDNVNEYVHPTQKPVELITYALQNSSLEDQLVIDFFGGSGSTLIACEKKRRICYAMELDPKFVQVIINRYALYYGSIENITCLNRDLKISQLVTE